MAVAEEQAQLVARLLEVGAADQRWAMVTLGTGALALVGAVICFFIWPTPFARGAGWPLGVLGAVFLVSGLTTYRRVTTARAQLPDVVREAPHLVESTLLPEAEDETTRLAMLRWFDGALVLVGVALATRRGGLRGAGAGLLLLAAVSLGFDSLALERTEQRRADLAQLVTSTG